MNDLTCGVDLDQDLRSERCDAPLDRPSKVHTWESSQYVSLAVDEINRVLSSRSDGAAPTLAPSGPPNWYSRRRTPTGSAPRR